MKNLLTAVLISASALTAAAQTAPTFTSSCEREKRNNSGNDRTQRACESRDLTLPAPGGKTLTIDGNQNGGIVVRNWSGAEVRVRAMVTTWGGNAQQRLSTVQISTDNNTLRADASGGGNWAVSYEVFVPQQTSLALNTNNGGISLENVSGTISFQTTNGGVSLAGLGGDVKGRTSNGGLSITLTGDKWDGTGLDVATVNTELPITKNGSRGRQIAATLGQGGGAIKAVTINGGISVQQK